MFEVSAICGHGKSIEIYQYTWLEAASTKIFICGENDNMLQNAKK